MSDIVNLVGGIETLFFFILGIGLIIYAFYTNSKGKIQFRGKVITKEDNPKQFRKAFQLTLVVGIIWILVGFIFLYNNLKIN